MQEKLEKQGSDVNQAKIVFTDVDLSNLKIYIRICELTAIFD